MVSLALKLQLSILYASVHTQMFPLISSVTSLTSSERMWSSSSFSKTMCRNVNLFGLFTAHLQDDTFYLHLASTHLGSPVDVPLKKLSSPEHYLFQCFVEFELRFPEENCKIVQN